MEKVHMIQLANVFNQGWTRCHRPKWVKRTGDWNKVTCKQCLKYRKKRVVKCGTCGKEINLSHLKKKIDMNDVNEYLGKRIQQQGELTWEKQSAQHVDT